MTASTSSEKHACNTMAGAADVIAKSECVSRRTLCSDFLSHRHSIGNTAAKQRPPPAHAENKNRACMGLCRNCVLPRTRLSGVLYSTRDNPGAPLLWIPRASFFFSRYSQGLVKPTRGLTLVVPCYLVYEKGWRAQSSADAQGSGARGRQACAVVSLEPAPPRRASAHLAARTEVPFR